MDAILAAQQHFHGFMDGRWTWFWPIALALQVTFWVVVIWLVARFAGPWLRSRQPKGPERILAERFADGAISEEDYRRRLDVIRGSRDA